MSVLWIFYAWGCLQTQEKQKGVLPLLFLRGKKDICSDSGHLWSCKELRKSEGRPRMLLKHRQAVGMSFCWSLLPLCFLVNGLVHLSLYDRANSASLLNTHFIFQILPERQTVLLLPVVNCPGFSWDIVDFLPSSWYCYVLNFIWE